MNFLIADIVDDVIESTKMHVLGFDLASNICGKIINFGFCVSCWFNFHGSCVRVGFDTLFLHVFAVVCCCHVLDIVIMYLLTIPWRCQLKKYVNRETCLFRHYVCLEMDF